LGYLAALAHLHAGILPDREAVTVLLVAVDRVSIENFDFDLRQSILIELMAYVCLPNSSLQLFGLAVLVRWNLMAFALRFLCRPGDI
jgi:hypothetical protein